jgi:hypothetical protein
VAVDFVSAQVTLPYTTKAEFVEGLTLRFVGVVAAVFGVLPTDVEVVKVESSAAGRRRLASSLQEQAVAEKEDFLGELEGDRRLLPAEGAGIVVYFKISTSSQEAADDIDIAMKDVSNQTALANALTAEGLTVAAGELTLRSSVPQEMAPAGTSTLRPSKAPTGKPTSTGGAGEISGQVVPADLAEEVAPESKSQTSGALYAAAGAGAALMVSFFCMLREQWLIVILPRLLP